MAEKIKVEAIFLMISMTSLFHSLFYISLKTLHALDNDDEKSGNLEGQLKWWNWKSSSSSTDGAAGDSATNDDRITPPKYEKSSKFIVVGRASKRKRREEKKSHLWVNSKIYYKQFPSLIQSKLLRDSHPRILRQREDGKKIAPQKPNERTNKNWLFRCCNKATKWTRNVPV